MQEKYQGSQSSGAGDMPEPVAANEGAPTQADIVNEEDGGLELNPIDELGIDLAAAQSKVQELEDAFLRAKADAENIRRRAQEDIAKAHKYGIEGFAESLLPVMDSLNAALSVQNATPESYREGMEITRRQMANAFEKYRLLEIDPVGEKFDPHKHQAISQQASDTVPPNHVVSTLQKGYMIADRVLRPALVVVSGA